MSQVPAEYLKNEKGNIISPIVSSGSVIVGGGR